jgi:hypothetical protein
VLLKLIKIVTLNTVFRVHDGCYADKEFSRHEKIRKQARKEEKKNLILDIYKKIDITNKSKHRVATEVHNKLIKKEQKPPSIATIKRRLEEEDLTPFDKS